MSVDFNVEDLKRSILNLSEARAQLETKVLVYANPVKTIKKSRQTLMKRPSKFIENWSRLISTIRMSANAWRN